MGIGSQLTTGEGQDTIDFSQGILITDADGYDRVNFGGRSIDSAIKWGGSESAWASTFGGLVSIGFNDNGEMVIRSRIHNKPSDLNEDAAYMYLANGNSNPFAASADLTAGIRTAQIEIDSYRVFHNPEGRSLAENAAIWDFMQLLLKDFFAETRVAGPDPLVLDLDGDGVTEVLPFGFQASLAVNSGAMENRFI